MCKKLISYNLSLYIHVIENLHFKLLSTFPSRNLETRYKMFLDNFSTWTDLEFQRFSAFVWSDFKLLGHIQ